MQYAKIGLDLMQCSSRPVRCFPEIVELIIDISTKMQILKLTANLMDSEEPLRRNKITTYLFVYAVRLYCSHKNVCLRLHSDYRRYHG